MAPSHGRTLGARPTVRANEKGFTLVELLAVLALTTVLLTVGASALGHYWRGRALTGARDAVAAQMKLAQQKSFSESYPTIYGVRFEKGSNRWALVRYNATTATCNVMSQFQLDGVTIATDAAVTDFPEGPAATACRNASPGAAAANEIAFFYPRGTASGGTVGLTSPSLGKTSRLSVNATTGRVTAL